MKIEVIIETGDDGTFDAVINPDKDYDLSFGLLGQGNSVKETIDDFYNSLKEMEELFVDEGKEFPKDLEFEFRYDIPSFLAYYSDKISLAGLGRLTGINRKQLSHYLTRHSRPSEKTVKKIEKALHEFGNELSHVNFV